MPGIQMFYHSYLFTLLCIVSNLIMETSLSLCLKRLLNLMHCPTTDLDVLWVVLTPGLGVG